jgi:exonuclease SbcC
MQLLELNLHNYKVHRKKKIEFESGVVGIVGDNGSGKSSIISAICFLFTGETDTPRKSDCVTQGETEGWVKGRFSLNGKEGTLERHLSSSTVILTYDGVTYKKKTEVDQLWNDLLQIDSTIFNNVIVAKQGEIQNLFSDETSVREKIFQKIFMVPPTEKIRSIISDNYIKTCPPERPEEDVQQLQTLQAKAAQERNQILSEIDTKTSQLAKDEIIRCINESITFLEKCVVDTEKKPELESKIREFCLESADNEIKINGIESYFKTAPPIESLKKERDKLLAAKPVYNRKVSLQTEIDKLTNSFNADLLAELNQQAKDIDAEKSNASYWISEYNAKLRDILAEKNHLLQLRGHASCPTCKQTIPNREAYINLLMEQEIDFKSKLGQVNAKHNELCKESGLIWSEISKSDNILRRINYLKEEISKVKDVEFNQGDLDKLDNDISLVDALINALRDYRNRQVEITAELKVLQERLNNLATYEGNATIEHELAIYRAALEENKANIAEIAELQLSAGKLEHELLLLSSRISNSEQNKAYNLKRKEYKERLEEAHMLFSVGKFPRQLISTYMSNVQSSLTTYLEHFDLPYIVKVEDGFKIRLYSGD